MRCPSCHKKNSSKILHCVYCGSDLHTNGNFDLVSIFMIITAILQITMLIIVICMLANGKIATYYLKKDKIQTVSRITSTFSSVGKNAEFQKLLEDKVNAEVKMYDEGQKSAEDAISCLVKYEFSREIGFNDVDDAIATIQEQQTILDDYTQMKDEASQILSKGDIESSIRILNQINDKYPQYKEEIDNTIQETITNALEEVDNQISEIQKDIDLDVDDPDIINSIYEEITSLLQQIQNSKIDEKNINTSSAERLELCYNAWLDYNQKSGKYWGENGAFALATICEEYNDSGHYIESVNGSCVGYYQAQINSGDGESVYKDINTHRSELSSFSETIDETVYDSLQQQALEQWMDYEKKQYVTLANKYRTESGLHELEYNTAIENAASILVNEFDKYNDKEYVSSVITQYVPVWNHAWWVSHRQFSTASSAIASQKRDETNYLFIDDPTQFAVGMKFDQQSMTFDWAVILLY